MFSNDNRLAKFSSFAYKLFFYVYFIARKNYSGIF